MTHTNTPDWSELKRLRTVKEEKMPSLATLGDMGGWLWDNLDAVLELIAEVERQEGVIKIMANHNVELIDEIDALKAQRDEMAEALAALEPQKPADDPKDGPCCHEQNEDGLWIGTGCTCQNYGDAQSAALWADAMNRWIEWNNITQNLGEKPMTNATEITARDAALLFRNPSHFDELLSAFEASAEADTASKLDDALKAVARSSLNKTGGKTDG